MRRHRARSCARPDPRARARRAAPRADRRPARALHRAIRDLVGSGEGIFGIADSYPKDGPVPFARLEAIEHRSVAYRWKLRGKEARLRTTHGDFHPYNILFREGCDFTLLDASRGCVGDPADDLAALTINYVFGAVVCPEAFTEGIRPLWELFWSTYLEGSGDRDLGEVIAPFFAWRALVVASPVWYPTLRPEARDGLLSFAERLLAEERFDPRDLTLLAPRA
ncbi:MAG: phosphotransferase [Byssovorax sp.]